MRNITDLGSFAVKNDGSEDFKKFVLEPLNEIRNIAISLQYVGANTEMYYGIDERGFPNCSYYYEGFSHILTVQQIKDYLLSGVRPGEESHEDVLNIKLYPFAARKSEYIICSAIWYNESKKYEHQPKNIETGYVICGRRHHNCIQTNLITTGDKTSRDDVQGFLTSKDRFVDRKEGGDIAYTSGQIKEPTDCLFSEDLY